MNTVHLILQGKGGVGKSLISSLIAQYLGQDAHPVWCADTDPVNRTLSGYAALQAQQFDILNADKNIDPREFDKLVEALLATDADCVVDNGASTFVPLSAYMLENDVVAVLQEQGKRVFVHTVVTGGQAMEDTVDGLEGLVGAQSAPVVVWLNEFFGPVASEDGIPFEDSAVYTENVDRIAGLVRLHRRNYDTFGRDFEHVVKSRVTLEQAINDPSLGLMPRRRLGTIRKDIFDQLDQLALRA